MEITSLPIDTFLQKSIKSIAAPKKKYLKGKKVARFTLTDEQKRTALSEGRNHGLGYQFCNRNDGQLITIQPLSPCRDYLNDVVYTEITNKPYSAYGLHTTPRNLFKYGEGYLVVGICYQGSHGQMEYPYYKRDYKALEENYSGAEKLINWFEKSFNIDGKTKITKLQENRFLVTFPLFWSEGTYRISLLGLLIRVGIFYKDGDPINFLNNFKEDNSEVYIIKSIMPKIKRMLAGEIPQQNMSRLTDVHNCGIVNYRFS